ncbi:hypothetical protein Pst134EA_017971 [Puccinia striiformis f. sp. tritici]|uniref:hypothetical protein n=1 Tax=Puccinia striiformis f. sp. tritici TaxID=168172 RepID=UPI0020075FC3|nr:hypothetical protein Pst134EA_017971 [Puccinia striiformis f. sp. tritici]KAH9461682.1 hypothetical protein Pst134EA_017971 [Puccinia striiformis f. sp. tritici]
MCGALCQLGESPQKDRRIRTIQSISIEHAKAKNKRAVYLRAARALGPYGRNVLPDAQSIEDSPTIHPAQSLEIPSIGDIFEGRWAAPDCLFLTGRAEGILNMKGMNEMANPYYIQVTCFDKVVVAGGRKYIISFCINHLIRFTKEDQLEGWAEWARWGTELPIIVTDFGFKCYVGGDRDFGIDYLVRRYDGGALRVSSRVAEYEPVWPPLPKDHGWKI